MRRLAKLRIHDQLALYRYQISTYIARENIQPDRIIGHVLAEEMEKSDAVVIIWTQYAHDSPWVNGELAYARKIGKRVVLLRFGNVPLPDGWEPDRWYVPLEGVGFPTGLAGLFGPVIFWPRFNRVLAKIAEVASEEAQKRAP